MGLGGEGCFLWSLLRQVLTRCPSPICSLSILGLSSHGPELTSLSPKLPASSIQSRNTRCTGFAGEGE